MRGPTEADDPALPRWRDRVRVIAGYVGACVWGGLAAGILIGGLGGRLAMFVLRVTSGNSVVGLESDDGFTIGRLSPDTFFLILFAGAVGIAAGLLYGLVRVWLPRPLRAVSFGVLGALVGGSAIIHVDGIDFRLLEPRMLAVVMFIALPGVGAAALSLVMERMLERSQRRSPGWIGILVPLPALVLTGPLGLILVVGVALGYALEPKLHLIRIWQSRPVAWLGRFALILWAGVGLAALWNDIAGIGAL